MRYRQDRVTHELLPLDEWLKRYGDEINSGVYIIPDIQPYKSVAWDQETKKPVIIGGRRQHREFLRRNNYEEVGNG